jgi:hypothetical protein
MSALAVNVAALQAMATVAPSANTRALSTLSVENYFSQLRHRCGGGVFNALKFAEEHSKVTSRDDHHNDCKFRWTSAFSAVPVVEASSAPQLGNEKGTMHSSSSRIEACDRLLLLTVFAVLMLTVFAVLMLTVLAVLMLTVFAVLMLTVFAVLMLTVYTVVVIRS